MLNLYEIKYKKYRIKNLYDNNLLHGHLGNYDDESFGDTRIYFVVNPIDVAACPYQDYSKFRMAALTPVGIMKEGLSINDFVLTPEIEDHIDELVEKHLEKLEQEINTVEFKTHTVIQEVPNVNLSDFTKTIREITSTIAKDRYIKN